jgi:hypothetical protein
MSRRRYVKEVPGALGNAKARKTRAEVGSSAAVSAVSGPSDSAILEIHPDEVAVVREFLAIDDLSADGVLILQRSDPDHFASWPRMMGYNTGAVNTDVVCVRHLCSVDRLILGRREAHNNRDW